MQYRVLVGIILLLGLGFQYQLWFGEGGLAEVSRLREKVTQQQLLNAKLYERNAALQAQVLDLKQGTETVESLARLELGMIRTGETYFQIIE